MQKTIPICLAACLGASLAGLSQNTINSANTLQNQGNTVYQNSVPPKSADQAGSGMSNGMLPTTNLVTRGTNDLFPGGNTNRWSGTNGWPRTNEYNTTNISNAANDAVSRKH